MRNCLNQTLRIVARYCVLAKLIHNNDRIKMLGFAEQIYNARELWVSPGQSTIGGNCGFRALVKSFQYLDSRMYLFSQP